MPFARLDDCLGLDFELVVHEGQEKSSEPRDYAVNFKYKPRNTLADDFDL
jgi:hypothetical protein